MSGNWTRRQALRRGGAAAAGVAGLGLAGYVGYAWPHPEATAGTPDSTAGTHPAATDAPSPAAVRPATQNSAAVSHFVTRSDIHPPAITVTRGAGGASQPPYIFVAPRGYTSASIGQSGLMIGTGTAAWSGSGNPLVGHR
jgi:hypothetical protein